MSVSTEQAVEHQDFEKILELAAEPSYISEIARKLVNNDPDWEGISVRSAVSKVSFVLNQSSDRDDINEVEVPYGEDSGQVEGSPRYSMVNVSDEVVETEWRDYKIIHNEGIDESDIRDEYLDVIDTSMTVEDKVDMITEISRLGNEAAKNSELIMQDVLKRQFKHYDFVEVSDYNDPGLDFWVDDQHQRDYGLAIEVTTRYVNPVDDPYIDTKKDMAFDRDSDLLILGPKFTYDLINKYEHPEDKDWHLNPESELVHLHDVPSDKPHTYEPFAYERVDTGDSDNGNPIIVPDSGRAKEKFSQSSHVGDAYPIVDSDYSDFTELLDYVDRDYNIVTESQYRNQIREAIEPLIWNFMRPYWVEQFLLSTYWDNELTQSEVGKLLSRDVDESESGHVSGGTIGDWMNKSRWDILTRGTGTQISSDTEDIWVRMYEGRDPFPEKFSGYRIQAEYNRFPHWDLEDWEEWYQNSTEGERQEAMSHTDSYRNNLSYTIMLDSSDRLTPSYSLILNRLREAGVDIRGEDTAPRGRYSAYGDARTIEWMINRNEKVASYTEDANDRLENAELEMFDSYLEVDVATWLSDNEVPYAHEPFTVPSMYGASDDMFDKMVERLRAIGSFDFERANEIATELQEEGYETPIATWGNDRIQGEWASIYDKHDLASLRNSPEVLGSLERFRRSYVLPDLVVYNDLDVGNVEEGWDGWDEWTHILEVGGLWGLELPEDANEDEWWDWYRVSGVAFKEFMYKLLGLWGDVYFLVPFQPDIEGETQTTPRELREDDHYIVFGTTQAGIDLGELADTLSVYKRQIGHSLSQPIEPVKYRRSYNDSDIEPEMYGFDSVNWANVSRDPNSFIVDDDMFAYVGEIGELFITDGEVYVSENEWMHDNMIFLREYVAESLSELNENGVIEGFGRVDG